MCHGRHTALPHPPSSAVRRIDSSEHLAKYHDCEIVASIVSITTKSANPGTGANITPRVDKFARTWYT